MSRGFGLLLVALPATFLAVQIAELRMPEEPGYVQRYALSDIPETAVSRGGSLEVPNAEVGEAESVTGGTTAEEGSWALNSLHSFPGPDRWDAPLPSTGASRQSASGLPVIQVDFDLARQGAQPGDLSVSKEVIRDGRRLGSVNVAIDQASGLYIAGDDLARLLPGQFRSAIQPGGELRSFEQLRAGGIDIRYDPVRDVLEISTSAAAGA